MHPIQQAKTPWLIKGTIVVLLLCLVTPFLYNSHFIFPFITTKTLWLRIMVELAALLYFLAALYFPRYRPQFTLLVKSLALYFGIIMIASLFGINWYRSFWGNIERGEGILTIVHVFAFSFILLQVLRDRKSWEIFLGGSLLVALLVSGYGLAQFLGIESPYIINTSGSRLSGTIGNASFLAGYLLMHTFIAAWFIMTPRHWLERSLSAASFIFLWFIIYHTGTRGALLAGFFVYSILICILAFFIPLKQGKYASLLKNSTIVFFILLAGFGVIFWFNKKETWVQKSPTLSRIASISWNDITTQSRVLTWRSSLQALKSRPILGYGYENYNVAFNRHFDARIYRDAGSQIWFDRAHNFIFDILVTVGVLGFAAYCVVYAVSLRNAVVLFRSDEHHLRLTGLFMGSLLIAHLIQALFVFDILATYVPLMLIMAFLQYMVIQDSSPAPAAVRIAPPSLPLPAIAIVAVVITGIGMYVFNIKPALANIEGLEAMRFAANSLHRDAYLQYRQALALDTYQSQEIGQKFAEFAMGLKSGSDEMTDEEIAEVYNVAIDQILENIKQAPQDTQSYMYLMNLYYFGSKFNKDRLNLIEKVGNEALKLSPTRPQIYYLLGQSAAERGKYDEAVSHFEKAVALNPEVFDSHWNLSVAYRFANRKEDEKKEYETMANMGLNYESKESQDEQGLLRLAQQFLSLQDHEKLAGIYEVLVERNPGNFEYIAHLATAYRSGKRYDKASETAKILLQIRPEAKDEIEKFLAGIEEERKQQSQ